MNYCVPSRSLDIPQVGDVCSVYANAIDTQIKENQMKYMTRSEAEALAKNAATALALIDAREGKYGVDSDYKNGAILIANIRYNDSDTVYTYALLKAKNMWYSTATSYSGFKRGSFDAMIDWLENVNGEIVSLNKVTRTKTLLG